MSHHSILNPKAEMKKIMIYQSTKSKRLQTFHAKGQLTLTSQIITIPD